MGSDIKITKKVGVKNQDAPITTDASNINFKGAGVNATVVGSEVTVTFTGSTSGVQSVTGLDTDNTDPLNPIVNISVDGVTITGDGTPLNPLVSVTNIPQSNIIYIDSNPLIGINSTGRGNINNPYLTPEYALADITNTGTVTATTTNGSATLTAVSSTASIVIGQVISGAGITWGSIVQSKTANTIVLSQLCTASATITVKWLTIYELNLSGNFIATSNWLKEGFYFARNESVSVSWGAFTLYDLNSVHTANYFNDGGFNYNGLTTTSKFFDTNQADPNANFILTINHSSNISLTTGYLYFHNGVYNLNYGQFNFKGKTTIAKFGYVWVSPYYLSAQINVDFDYSYGLLGGVISQGGDKNLNWKGSIDCPASVLAVSMPGTCFNYQGNYINGSISIIGTSQNIIDFNPSRCNGTTFNIANVNTNARYNADVNCSDNVNFYGYSTNYVWFIGSNGKMYGSAVGAFAYSGGKMTIYTRNVSFSVGVYANSELTIESDTVALFNGSLNVPSGAKIINNSVITIDNANGLNSDITGTFINNGKVIFTQGTYDSMRMNAGCLVKNYGTLQSTYVTTTSSLIPKVGGTLELYANSKLIVGNAKPPIECTLNTADSKDIFMFGCISNGNSSTYGLFFAFDGGSYVPNDLVGGVLYENTIY
jgi:hypothetical protein